MQYPTKSVNDERSVEDAHSTRDINHQNSFSYRQNHPQSLLFHHELATLMSQKIPKQALKKVAKTANKYSKKNSGAKSHANATPKLAP